MVKINIVVYIHTEIIQGKISLCKTATTTNLSHTIRHNNVSIHMSYNNNRRYMKLELDCFLAELRKYRAKKNNNNNNAITPAYIYSIVHIFYMQCLFICRKGFEWKNREKNIYTQFSRTFILYWI